MDMRLLVFVVVIAFAQGFTLRDIADFFLGGYAPNYPSYGGTGYPKPPLPGPPGAHAGCPLCDSSVYSYCSYKEAHDACCCDNSIFNFNCRSADCSYLYANSCQEYNLIASCCCIDVKNG